MIKAPVTFVALLGLLVFACIWWDTGWPMAAVLLLAVFTAVLMFVQDCNFYANEDGCGP